jgi:hypothetical protein
MSTRKGADAFVPRVHRAKVTREEREHRVVRQSLRASVESYSLK